MIFLTSCYWTEGKPATSLILQQVTRKRGKMPIVMACVCEENPAAGEQGTGESFCVHLTDWFHEYALERCSRVGKTGLADLKEELAQMAGTAGFSAAGILCVGEWFLLFYRGKQRICLLNSRFLRPNLKEISANTAESIIVMEEGFLQDKVGLLLGTESFYRGISEEEIRNCLAVNAVRNETQVNRRLEELGHFGESQQSGGRAAVLLMTR